MTDGKLVRDRIPEIIRWSGGDPEVRYVAGEELVAALGAKLCEEAKEASDAVGDRNQLLEELADVHEVMAALMDVHAISSEELAETAEKKSQERGAFTAGAWLVGVRSRSMSVELTVKQKAEFLEAFREAFGAETPGDAIQVLYSEAVARYDVNVDVVRALAQDDLAANRKVYAALRRKVAKKAKLSASSTKPKAAEPKKPKKSNDNAVPCPICKKVVSRYKATGELVAHEFGGRPCSGEVATCKVCKQKFPVRASDGRMTSHSTDRKKCTGSGRPHRPGQQRTH